MLLKGPGSHQERRALRKGEGMDPLSDYPKWKHIRSRVVAAAFGSFSVDDAAAVIQAAAHPGDGTLLREKVDKWISGIVPHLCAYGADDAIGLLGDIDRLTELLSADRERGALSGHMDFTARQALGQILKSYLDKQRLRVLPGKPHRRRGWEMKIALLSSKLADKHKLGPGEACEDDHIERVLERIKQIDDASRHNLPTTMVTLESYFREFCPDCRERNLNDMGELVHASPHFSARAKAILRRLYVEHPELALALATTVKRGVFTDVPYRQKDYMAEFAVTRAQLRARIEQARAIVCQTIAMEKVITSVSKNSR